MPTRLLREGILKSDRVEALDFAAEVFYRRLMSKVDDHGLFDARLPILRADLYPLRFDRVREADISRWMAACQKAGLIVLYESGGKPYLRMQDTNWVTRSEPKYPLPPTENNCLQPGTTVPLVVDVVLDVIEDVVVVPRKRGKQPKVSMPDDFGISDRVKAWAAEKGHNRLDLHLESFKSKCAAHGYTYANWDDAFMEAIRTDWAKLPASAPSAVRSGKPKGPSETPLERAVAYARQQHAFGQIDAAERDRLISDATEKHRRMQ